jgi:hypothetical protein
VIDFAGLRPFATERQREYLDALEVHGSARKVGVALGVHYASVSKSIRALVREAARRGYSPPHDMTHVVPDGFSVKGVSTYYDAEGKPRGQWVKSRADETAMLDRLTDLVSGLAEAVDGKFQASPSPAVVMSDYLTVYPIGDAHIGMYAWGEQTGEDFDLEIAERDLRGAMVRLVQASPASHTAIVLNLGDLLHGDSPSNTTARSGNVLDIDTRWEKVMRIGARIMFWLVEHALEKHQAVIVRNVQGNHDDTSSFALSLILEAYFRNEPRVQIETSPKPFWYYRFGKVLIGATHGDKVKQADLPSIMAADRAADWGETAHRYYYSGHIHHKDMKEHFGVVCESFRTLAASDNYHHSYGYRSGRDMHAIVHHREWGEVERHRADILRIRSEQ